LIPATRYNKNFYQKKEDQWTHQKSKNKVFAAVDAPPVMLSWTKSATKPSSKEKCLVCWMYPALPTQPRGTRLCRQMGIMENSSRIQLRLFGDVSLFFWTNEMAIYGKKR
jgi:hypothetical protein